MSRAILITTAIVAAVVLAAGPGYAQKKYGPGVSDTEIKIGQTMPYSGPASAYGAIGKAEAAYFKMVNEEKGGINGRKINFMSLDDGYSPPKTVEQVRRLVEEDQVLATFQTLGTPSNTAIHKYMNAKKVPQLFVATGATKWGDPKDFPWTMGWQPNYQAEAKIYIRYIKQNIPNAKIGMLIQNDDYGKDYLVGVNDALGQKDKAMLVKVVTYEVTDPTIDSQIIDLKASGANVFINITTPKFATMAIRKAYDIDWHPTQFLNNVSTSVGSVLTPAGLEKAKGVITIQYYKDPTDPKWKNEPDFKQWQAWMKKYNADANAEDGFNAYGYAAAATLEQTLRQCGDDLTRENVMKQAANLKDVKIPMLQPGVVVNTSPTDFYPIEQGVLSKFDGKTWETFGPVVSASNS
ncbi:MAG TPA: ABC transporter substrate-binding protein [Alphaproteobacteria bacterium]|nr:ABC transporter substrate-binding protein [Alphaproteobacteria bacterium]